ncbi:[Fe-Fe] hydrogenase large subunit C-terminal domain-containing protein [Clostridium sp. Ade.TY]|uniref:[Fe-Fe] hydrogenase large subunit C-terminal domain-containing protein n=1 Tax=Clostridium sp. Ade.TY TaxID=1391647 RepID=UPI00041C6FEE|nr:[Fe-Fe] hydrogenase large subunit C-terminal domain-containing protein [Clostridium sp. Ade.TY]
MNKKYKDILNKLIASYYNDNFDEEVKKILKSNDFSRDDLKSIISSLCGVSVPEGDNFIYNLKKSITDYSVKTKLVEKVRKCSYCKTDVNGKTNCQNACPFNAILKDTKTNNAYIDNNLCTDCGLCVSSCENGNYLEKIELIPLLELLKNNSKVIAAVAPAITGQFGIDVSMDQLRTAFIKLGFTDMIEVAFAADMLTIKEACEFNSHVNSFDDLLITSCCCPMWIGMIKGVYSSLVKHVTPSVSPMIAAARVIKYLNKDVKVVFIGPCIAKKAEAREKDLVGDVDLVLTFEEVKGLFDTLNINLAELNETITREYASRGGRLYARTDGVTTAIKDAVNELYPDKIPLFKGKSASGVKACKELLNEVKSSSNTFNFIEGMGCIGGCVGGPKKLIDTNKGTEYVTEFAHSSPIKVATHSDVIIDLFKRLGINNFEDLLDKEKTKIFHRTF